MGKLAVSKLVYFITILVTFFIVLVTIISALAVRIDPTNNVIMGYLGIILPALLVLNIVLIVYWGLRWKLWVWFPILALAANVSCITAMFQFSSEKETSGPTLKTASYNIRAFNNEITGFSAKEVARVMSDEGVDIISFQEFYANHEFSMDSILNTFYEYPHTAIPYIGRSTRVAIFSKYPIIDFSLILFPGETSNCGMWADIQVDNKIVRVFNLHMQTNNLARSRSQLKYKSNQDKLFFLGGELAKNFMMRAEQANLVRDIINNSKSPIILCGDLNDTPASYTYGCLKGNLKDGFKTCGSGYGYTFRGMYNLLRIDYIFHSSDIKGISYKSPALDISDHNPVFFKAQL